MQDPKPTTGKWLQALAASLLALVLLLSARRAEAQTPAEPSEAAAPDAGLAEAKELFRTGYGFMNNGDYHRALELFLKSRALVPSWQNTLNIAYCLDNLTRSDEALEYFERTLIEFSKELPLEKRQRIEPRIVALRDALGSLEMSANVDGIVVIDGRERGRLPLGAPVRLLPGERLVRIMRDGYETFEERVKVVVQRTQHLDAQLKVLKAAGALQVDLDENGESAELLIDGAHVGPAPWRGTLAPGPHVYQVVRGETGSNPHVVRIVEKQTISVRPVLRPLSQVLSYAVEPPTARLLIDEVPLGASWQGRLALGPHQLAAREEGYFAEDRQFIVSPETRGQTLVKLRVDRNHPRWVKPLASSSWSEAFGGYAFGPSLGSDAEACANAECVAHAAPKGLLVGARFAYEFPIPVSLELGAGYLSISSGVRRRVTQPLEDVTATFDLRDEISLKGGLLSLGAGYRYDFAGRFGVQARVHVAALFASSRDDVTVRISAPGRDTVAGRVIGSGARVSAVSLLVQPELQVVWRAGALRAGLGLSALIMPIDGRRNDHGDAIAVDTCPAPPKTPEPTQCVQSSGATVKEKAFGPFAVFVPGVSVGYTF